MPLPASRALLANGRIPLLCNRGDHVFDFAFDFLQGFFDDHKSCLATIIGQNYCDEGAQAASCIHAFASSFPPGAKVAGAAKALKVTAKAASTAIQVAQQTKGVLSSACKGDPTCKSCSEQAALEAEADFIEGYINEATVCPGDCKGKCFPADATVQLADGSRKRMDAVRRGDLVMTAQGQFSEVYFFSHEMADASSEFVQVSTATGSVLQLTAEHHMYINGKIAPARTAKVGDNVTDARGDSVAVSSVQTVVGKGLYNPHTLHGDIVVNGVLTSSYTSALSPGIAHVLLAPFRALHRIGVTVSPSHVAAVMSLLRSTM